MSSLAIDSSHDLTFAGHLVVRRALLVSVAVGGHLAAAGWMAQHAPITPATLIDAPSVVVDISPLEPVPAPAQPMRHVEPAPVAQPTPVVRHAPAAQPSTPPPEAPTEPIPVAAHSTPVSTEPPVFKPTATPAQDSAIATAMPARHELPSADRISPHITPARFDADYLHNPKPAYPAFARRMGEVGKVLLRVSVTPQGLPDSVAIATSSGSPRLDDAALQTVKRWRFVPARQGETAVQSWVTVPITFNLEG